jgi:hypothetical protein
MADEKTPKINMSRAQAEAIIKGGGSVMLGGYNGGQPIDSLDKLPDEVAFAVGDPEREDATLEELDARIKTLQEKRTSLARHVEARKSATKASQASQEGRGESDEGQEGQEADEPKKAQVEPQRPSGHRGR